MKIYIDKDELLEKLNNCIKNNKINYSNSDGREYFRHKIEAYEVVIDIVNDLPTYNKI